MPSRAALRPCSQRAGLRGFEPIAAVLRLTGWRIKDHCVQCRFRPGHRGRRPARNRKGIPMTYSRAGTRAAGLLGLAALATVAALPALEPAEAGPSYDGLRSVVTMTKTGQCDPAYR